jgi:superfamily II DNA or RNA helicase
MVKPAPNPPAAKVVAGRLAGSPEPAVPSSAWEAALDVWLAGTEPCESDGAPVGLQFEVRPTSLWVRLATPSRAGWVRTNISWQHVQFGWTKASVSARARRLLQEMLTLATQSPGAYLGYGHEAIVDLVEVRSRRIWDLLAEAREADMPLVQVGKRVGSVLIAQEPVRVTMSARQDEDDIVLTPALVHGDVAINRATCIFVGDPAHGLVWSDQSGDSPLWLGPLARALDGSVRRALGGPPVRVPAAQRERFFEHVYPQLRGAVEVVSDGSIDLPESGRTQLALAVAVLGEGGLRLAWSWRTPFGGRDRVEPLWTTGPASVRAGQQALPVPDLDRREALLRRVVELVAKPVPTMVDDGPRLLEAATIKDDQLVRFLSEVLPALSELDDVEIDAPAEVLGLDYHEIDDRPVITFASGDTDDGDERDWFDLAVEITVDGERVPFQQLFVALAEERELLLLPSGAYLSLDRPEFRRLAALIAESRELEDAPPGVVRLGRLQASLWADLAQLGAVTGAAAAWQRSISGLLSDDAGSDVAVPVGLRAELRPYQKEGLRWLVARHAHRLGGILADDMGLGKTIQALAFMCHARSGELASRSTTTVSEPNSRPFLVVAPASVVSNWVSEAHRFTPDLDVRAVAQTQSRRLVPLTEAVAGADIVVTSYTLFRLEFDDYRTIDWAGLVLDEAQFVKNSQSQAYRCAQALPAGVKLAITGTPMENNLGELWSLVSITAPGLFPRLDQFTEHYREPIERGHDQGRLEQLRRLIRPFMLRRRKSDVAIDLPPKQEQVVGLELDPKHRKAYQTYLQRERQKVLGLLGDLERNRFEVFRSLTLLRQASLDVTLVGHKGAVPSTKLDHLTEQLAAIAAEGHRTLVFSQFTRFLGAARERLEKTGIACSYLDGKSRDRATVIEDFRQGENPVFLISLKAGGFGLNLTEADYCILLDPWWNPATEAQAVDRVHRIGQARNVMVYRLVAKDTIEEKVMALKERKAELFRGVVDDGEFADASLTAADIRALLD